MRSIFCSPPESVPARCCSRAFNTGNQLAIVSSRASKLTPSRSARRRFSSTVRSWKIDFSWGT